MIEEKKDVIVPEETEEKLLRVSSLRNLVSKSVKLFWGEKRAIRYQVEAKRTLWDVQATLHSLFPYEMGNYTNFYWGMFDGEFKVRFYNKSEE